MGVLAKVSAAYTKLKADNADLQKTIKILELENETLKEILLKRCKTDKEVEREINMGECDCFHDIGWWWRKIPSV